MEKEYNVLRKEFNGVENSFIFKLRGEFVWDKRAFSELILAMKKVCEESEDLQVIERWVANVFWYSAIFVKAHTLHPEFPKPYEIDYYEKAFILIEELGEWFFTGSCPVLDKEIHFII